VRTAEIGGNAGNRTENTLLASTQCEYSAAWLKTLLPARYHATDMFMHFQNFDAAEFLRDYWQQRPLLIRNPWTAWSNPVDPGELAGLACEDEVESRLVEHSDGDWRVENGPFAEERFGTLGAKHWTLLVQAVDHYAPDVAALIAPFRFIPDWRIDDVMVSLAADGGGVGPHFDQYDVFLIQGLGRRRWQLGAACDSQTALLPHDELRLLARFAASEEYVLEPGDILYIPPGIAHNGVAVGDDCMTYSIGFRAPSRADLIGHYCDDVLDRLADDDRYSDAGLAPQVNAGEVTASALAALHDMVTQRLGDRDGFARWFGAYSSTPKYADMDWSPETPVDPAQLRAWVRGGEPLCRNPASRFCFIRRAPGDVMLFVDGTCFECTGETAVMAELLCAQHEVTMDLRWAQSDAAMVILAALIDRGSLAFVTCEPG
jgi:50S ribosomal protein L16 3-hydroxylase